MRPRNSLSLDYVAPKRHAIANEACTTGWPIVGVTIYHTDFAGVLRPGEAADARRRLRRGERVLRRAVRKTSGPSYHLHGG